jgi:Uma2 family endonuclease
VVMTMPEHETRTAADEAMASSVEGAFEALSAAAPEGWRVELIEGAILVTPPANGEHEEILSEINGQMRDHHKSLGRYQGIGLLIPGASPTGKVIPDLVIAPKASFRGVPDEYHDPAAVLMVCEVTSNSTGDNDRGRKLRGYARAGIPCYLLVDREADVATLFTEPVGESYRYKVEVSISKPLALPEPFGFDLDTRGF